LRDVFYPVLKFKDEKQTFAKVEGPKVDFFLSDSAPDWASYAVVWARAHGLAAR